MVSEFDLYLSILWNGILFVISAFYSVGYYRKKEKIEELEGMNSRLKDENAGLVTKYMLVLAERDLWENRFNTLEDGVIWLNDQTNQVRLSAIDQLIGE